MTQNKTSYGKRYKSRLILCFSAAFALFAVALLVFQIRFERQSRLEFAINDLSTYAEILSESSDYEQTKRLLPPELRVTVLNNSGEVLYESIKNAHGENYLTRPEVSKSINGEASTCIRVSKTTGKKYLYYSKPFEDKIIRVAIPYNDSIRPQLRPGSIFMLIVALLFLVSVLVIILLSYRFSSDILKFQKQYKDDSDREFANIKQQMTSNISHELRTPVTGILGYLETLESCPDMDEKQRSSFIHRAYIQAIRLSDLIRDMALISKIEESGGHLERHIVNVGEIVDEVKSEFEASLSSKNDIVYNKLSSDLRICANKTLLYALFRNLVENSIKYAGNSVQIQIGQCDFAKAGFEDEKESEICLYYSDNGAGVPSEHLPRIFERFYRISEGRSRDDGGSGLGLSIVRNAVAFHGGQIRVENENPHGLVFYFTLKK